MALTKEEEKAVYDILDNEFGLEYTGDGCYTSEIYADYRDEITKEDVIRLCEAEHPLDEFYIWMEEEVYNDVISEEYDELKDDVLDSFREKFGEITTEKEDEADELLRDIVSFKLPYEHFLRQKMPVDIFMDTGDANYEFTLNCHTPAWNGDDGDFNEKSSLLWLAETQGYDNDSLKNFLENDEKADPKTFLGSVYQELANEVSEMNEVVFLAEMSVRDILALNERLKPAKTKDGGLIYEPDDRPDCGTIHISRNATVGLFDSWNGGGSLFEIVLEKDIDVPVKYIYSALPDGGERCYGVESVYDMNRSEWKDVVSQV